MMKNKMKTYGKKGGGGLSGMFDSLRIEDSSKHIESESADTLHTKNSATNKPKSRGVLAPISNNEIRRKKTLVKGDQPIVKQNIKPTSEIPRESMCEVVLLKQSFVRCR